MPGLAQKVLDWFCHNKEHIDDDHAQSAVAFVIENYREAKPDLESVQILNPRDQQSVGLFRIPDLDGAHVYVVEVDFVGQLLSCTKRQIGMFENLSRSNARRRARARRKARDRG